MPRVVDHEERRRVIAEAVFAVIGKHGYESVSLRDVAAEAGISMGQVQHYFASKHEMLLFGLHHMRARGLARMAAELPHLVEPTRRQSIEAGLRVLLPISAESRQEAQVNVAFFSAATVTPEYAELIREGYQRLAAMSRLQLRAAQEAGELMDDVDVDLEADALFYATQGLIGPVLIGAVCPDDAMALLLRRLDQIFRPASST